MTEGFAPARSAGERKRDTLHRLRTDVDVWVATASDQGGEPYMMPLSFLWRDDSVYVSTRAANPVGRNLLANGQVQLTLGHTRDVVHIEGVAEALPEDGPDPMLREDFARRTDFDPAGLEGQNYRYFRIAPVTVRAWREVNELAGRVLMRDGKWLTED